MVEVPTTAAPQEERLRQNIDRLAGEIGERNFEHYSKLLEAAAFIEHSFEEVGYRSMRQEYEARGMRFANIEVELQGQDLPQEIVIVGAHYDTERGSPGANDNASGIVALLALAREFTHKRLSRTLRLVAFTNEERPFLRTEKMGSRVYAKRCRERNEVIVGMLSLETIAYCSAEKGSQWLSFFGLLYPSQGNFIALVANRSSRGLLKEVAQSFRRHTTIGCETAVLPTYFPGAWSSDHWSFWKEGYPALMVTDTAPLRYRFYHTPHDTPEKLRYDFLNSVVEGLKGVVSHLVTSTEAV
jgi:Zn-dependent M28 family amino/carboxypeptidase